MQSLLERLRSLRTQGAKLVIEAETPASLSVRNGRTLTVFDRLSRSVTQGKRQVASFGSIHQVRIDEQPGDDGAFAWSVNLELAGSRVVPIGRTRDGSEASVAAAHIATITGTRVAGKRAA
jgi:hypothetical protein